MLFKKKNYIYIIYILTLIPFLYLIFDTYILKLSTDNFILNDENLLIDELFNDTFQTLNQYSTQGKQILKEVDDKILNNPSEGKKFTFNYQQQFNGNANFHTSDIKFSMFFHRDTFNDTFGTLFAGVDNTIKRFYQLFNLFPLYYYQNSSIESMFFISTSKIAFYFPNNELREKFSEQDDIFKGDYFTRLTTVKNPEKKIVYSNVFMDASKKFQVISVLHPLYDKKLNEFLGTLGIDYNLKPLLQHILKYNNKQKGRIIYLFDSSKNIYGIDKELCLSLSLIDQTNKDKAQLTLDDFILPNKTTFFQNIDNSSDGHFQLNNSSKEYDITFRELKPFPLKICSIIRPDITSNAQSTLKEFKDKLDFRLFIMIGIFILFFGTALILLFALIRDIKSSSLKIITNIEKIKLLNFDQPLLINTKSIFDKINSALIDTSEKLKTVIKPHQIEHIKETNVTADFSKDRLYQLFLDGSKLLEQEKLSEALLIFTKLLNEEPSNYKVLVNIGLIHFKQKDYHSALLNWEKAIQINPSLIKVQKNIEKLKQFLSDKQDLK